jgi:hypothetical protein
VISWYLSSCDLSGSFVILVLVHLVLYDQNFNLRNNKNDNKVSIYFYFSDLPTWKNGKCQIAVKLD